MTGPLITGSWICYSKELENHIHHFALFAAYFNYVRVSGAHQQTPAMAAGLTDHVWTVEELLTAVA